MSTRQKEWIVGATTLGAIFGGFFAGLVRFASLTTRFACDSC